MTELLDVQDFPAEASRTRELIRDLHQPRPALYWLDLLVTACLAWSAFAAACILPAVHPATLAALSLAVVALYRGLCFVHEISHLGSRTIPGFGFVWNIVFGYPLLMPTFVYCGVHQSHHKLSTYGTSQDPEYMAFARSSRMTVIFALESFFIPLALLVRFLVMTPAGFVIPQFEKWLVVHASSLTMNLEYRRDPADDLIRSVRRHSAAIWLIWVSALSLAVLNSIPWRVFETWLLVSACISFVNTLRTLGAHAYESDGKVLDRQGQLLDSIDTPGAPWTELWAPVGLRYHALHHYFPGIPYHNLGHAYRRLAGSLPENASYHEARSRSLAVSLLTLYRKGHR